MALKQRDYRRLHQGHPHEDNCVSIEWLDTRIDV